MELNKEQQAILDGSQGEVMSKIMKTLVMYGETFGATKMVEVTSTYGHIVTSFGIFIVKGVFELLACFSFPKISIIALLSAVLTIVCGVLLIVSKWEMVDSFLIVIGVILILDGIFMFFGKKLI